MSTNPLYPVIEQQVIDEAMRRARRERSEAFWRWISGKPIAEDQPEAQRGNRGAWSARPRTA